MKGLMLHAGAKPISMDELAYVDPPPPQGPRHRPLAHYDFVDMIYNSLFFNLSVKYKPDAFQLAIGGKSKGIDGKTYSNVDLFGIIQFDVLNPQTLSGITEGWSTQFIGFSSNLMRRRRYHMVAGDRVFVCDNLAITGVSKTSFMHIKTKNQLEKHVALQVNQFIDSATKRNNDFNSLKLNKLSYIQAEALTLRLHTIGKLPARMLRPTYEAWDAGTTADTTGRNAWSLHNAATRQLASLPLNTKLRHSEAISKVVFNTCALSTLEA